MHRLVLALVVLAACAKPEPAKAAPPAASPGAAVQAQIDKALEVRERGDSEAAARLMNLAVQLAREQHDRAGEALALHREGDVLLDLDQCAPAKERYLAAMKLHEALHDVKLQGRAANDLGLWARSCAHEEAAKWFQLAMKLRADDPPALAKSANNLGALYWSMGNETESAAAYDVALQAAVKANDGVMQRKVLANLALLWALAAEQDVGADADAEDEPPPVPADSPSLKKARDYFQRAVAASKAAGEDPINVCATFGRYENRCARLMPAQP